MTVIPLYGQVVVDAVASRETVTVATSLEEVEALRAVWAALPVAEIDSDIDYYMTVVRHARQVIRPHVVHVRRDDGTDLIGVARLEDLSVAFRFGYRILGRVSLRAVVVTFGGMLGARSRQDETLLLKHLAVALDSGEADLLLMRNVDPGGSLHAVAAASAGWVRRAHAQPISSRWIAPVPDTLETFLASRSARTRQTLSRHDRQLRKHYGDRLRLRRLDRVEDRSDICSDIETVASKTYQRGLGVGFTGDPMHIALIDLGLRRGWHRTWMLYLDDKPVAFWTGYAYAGTFFDGTPGFDPEYTRDSIGRFTMLRMVEDLCADPAIERLDFGQGEAEYKAGFGRCDHMETDVMVAARRLWPVAVVLALSALSFVNGCTRRLIEGSAWGRRFKAGWRRRLARAD